jgi:trigger factor
MPIADKNKELNFEQVGDYKFYFEVGLQPLFDLDLKAIKPTYHIIEPTDDMLDRFVEDIRRKFGKFESPEAIGETDVVFGDIIVCSFNSETEESANKIKTSFAVDKIASNTIKKKVIGTKIDESIKFNVHEAFTDIVDVASMLKMQSEDAEKVTDVQFTPTSISRVEMAEMNENFFEKAYPQQDIKTEEDFKARAKKDLMDTYAREADRYFLNDVSTSLVKDLKIELPDDFLKRWLEAISKDEKDKVKAIDDYDKYRDSIKWQLIESQLYETYNINVTNEEVKDYYKSSLLINYFPVKEDATEEEKKQRDESMDKIATNLLQNKEQVKQVFDYLYDNKLTAVLKANIASMQKTITIDEFSKMVTEKNKAAQ